MPMLTRVSLQGLDRQGQTPLHPASTSKDAHIIPLPLASRHAEVCSKPLQYGVSIDLKDNVEYTTAGFRVQLHEEW